MIKKLRYLSTLLLIAVASAAWGEEESVTFSEQGYSNAQEITSYTGTNFSITFDKGTNNNAPKYYTAGTAIRVYGSNTFTVSSTNTITQIALTFGENDGSNPITTDVGTYSDGTWTGSSTSVVFTVGGTSGHRRLAGLTVTYTPAASDQVSMPSISGTSPFYPSTEVSITCGTEGATISYSTDGTNWNDYSSPFTLSETTTVYAKATKTGLTDSETASKLFTKMEMMTILDTRSQAVNSTVLTKGIVTSISSDKKTAFIQDEKAAIAVYNSSQLSVSIGDEITVQGTLTTYSGLLEIGSAIVNVLSQNNKVDPEVMTIAEINESTNQGWLVKIENATVTAINDQNTTISQGDNTIVVRGISGVEIAVNNIITLTGNIGCFSNAAQIANPQNVTIVATGAPHINASDLIEIEYNATSGSIAYTIDNPVNDKTLSATTSADWLTLDTPVDNTIPFTCSVNGGEEDRTATVKLTYGDVSKEVTVTQKHFVIDYAELPFEFDGGKADVATTAGLTQNSLGTDYGSSPKLKFDETSDWLILKFNEQPGKLTFDIKGNSFSGGTFTVQTSEDGLTYNNLETYTELGATQNKVFDNLGENVRYIKWIYTEKASGNVALGNIKLEKPGQVNPPVITAENVTINADATFGEIPYSIANPVNDVELTAATDANWISNIDVSAEKITFSTTANTGDADRTATFILKYEGAESKEVTVTQRHFVEDFATLPFKWEGGASSDFLALDGVSAEGLGSDYAANNAPYLIKFDGTGDYIQVKTNERPGIVTIGVKMLGGSNPSSIMIQESADGETFTDLQSLSISGSQNDVLTLTTTTAFEESSRYVRLYFTKGSNVGVGPITIAQYADIVLNDYILAIANPANVNITATYSTDIILNNGENASVTEGTEITLAVTPASGYVFENLTISGEEEGQTVTPVATSTEGVWTFTMPSYDVTINATVTEYVAPVTANYTLATSITPGKRYIIVGVNDGIYKAMGEQKNNNRAAVGIEVNDGTATVTSTAGVYEFMIGGKAEDGYTIYDETTPGYLYAASSGSNYLRTQETNDANGLWTISFGEGGVASVVAKGTNTHNVMQYNSGSASTSALFACYASASQSPVYLYEIAKRGDVNNDGHVDIADVTKLVNIIVSGAEPTTEQIAAGNLNPDKGLTVNDVKALVEMILSNSNQ